MTRIVLLRDGHFEELCKVKHGRTISCGRWPLAEWEEHIGDVMSVLAYERTAADPPLWEWLLDFYPEERRGLVTAFLVRQVADKLLPK